MTCTCQRDSNGDLTPNGCTEHPGLPEKQEPPANPRFDWWILFGPALLVAIWGGAWAVWGE